MELEITARSDRKVGAWKNVRVQEQDALDSLEAAHRGRSKASPCGSFRRRAEDHMTVKPWSSHDVAYDESMMDCLNGEFEKPATSAMAASKWMVCLGLHQWLRPMLLSQTDAPPMYDRRGLTTGVLIDAGTLTSGPASLQRLWDGRTRTPDSPIPRSPRRLAGSDSRRLRQIRPIPSRRMSVPATRHLVHYGRQHK